MNKIFWCRLGIAIFTLLTSVVALAAPNVVYLTNGEWPPYLSKDLPQNGFASHVVKEAFAAVDIEVEYGFFPWKRSLKYAEQAYGVDQHIWHGTVVWVYTPERAESFHYSAPVVQEAEHLFHLKSHPLEWSNVEDLNGMVIGATLHTAYPSLEQAERDGLLTLERGGNYDSLFRKLLYRGLDAIPYVKQVGQYFIDNQLTQEEAEQVAISPTVVDKREYYVLFSKVADPDGALTFEFNRGLALIKKSGRYAQLQRLLTQGFYDHF